MCAATAGSHSFEAGIAYGAHHQSPQDSNERHHQTTVKGSRVWLVLEERFWGKVYDGGNQSGSGWNGQAYKVLLINLGCPFCQDAWTRCLHIKTRQTKCTAHQIHERKKPA